MIPWETTDDLLHRTGVQNNILENHLRRSWIWIILETPELFYNILHKRGRKCPFWVLLQAFRAIIRIWKHCITFIKEEMKKSSNILEKIEEYQPFYRTKISFFIFEVWHSYLMSPPCLLPSFSSFSLSTFMFVCNHVAQAALELKISYCLLPE